MRRGRHGALNDCEEVRKVKVAVIGTGTLGPAIAQVFSQCDSIEKIFLCKGREESRYGKPVIAKAFDKLVSKKN